MSVMHDCITGISGLYNLLLLGAANDTEDLAASAMDCTRYVVGPAA